MVLFPPLVLPKLITGLGGPCHAGGVERAVQTCFTVLALQWEYDDRFKPPFPQIKGACGVIPKNVCPTVRTGSRGCGIVLFS